MVGRRPRRRAFAPRGRRTGRRAARGPSASPRLTSRRVRPTSSGSPADPSTIGTSSASHAHRRARSADNSPAQRARAEREQPGPGAGLSTDSGTVSVTCGRCPPSTGSAPPSSARLASSTSPSPSRSALVRGSRSPLRKAQAPTTATARCAPPSRLPCSASRAGRTPCRATASAAACAPDRPAGAAAHPDRASPRPPTELADRIRIEGARVLGQLGLQRGPVIGQVRRNHRQHSWIACTCSSVTAASATAAANPGSSAASSSPTTDRRGITASAARTRARAVAIRRSAHPSADRRCRGSPSAAPTRARQPPRRLQASAPRRVSSACASPTQPAALHRSLPAGSHASSYPNGCSKAGYPGRFASASETAYISQNSDVAFLGGGDADAGRPRDGRWHFGRDVGGDHCGVQRPRPRRDHGVLRGGLLARHATRTRTVGAPPGGAKRPSAQAWSPVSRASPRPLRPRTALGQRQSRRLRMASHRRPLRRPEDSSARLRPLRISRRTRSSARTRTARS